MAELGPKRTQYRGRLGADPGVVGLPPGAWWFRTDLNCWKWFDGTTINFLPLTDEIVIEYFYITTGGGEDYKDMTSAILSNINFVVHVDVIAVNPSQSDVYTPIHWYVNGTTIGVTIGAASSAAGTTITAEALFLGYR